MRAELQKLNSRLEAMSREELILSIRRLLEENAEKDAQLEINSSAATEMAVQFQQIKNENAVLKKENEELLRQNRNLTDQLQMRKNDLFGRKSENASGTIDAVFEESPEDPLDESSPEPEDTLSPDEPEHTEAAAAYEKERNPQGSGRPCGRKAAGKRQKDLDRLPTKIHYDLDVDELNRMYDPCALNNLKQRIRKSGSKAVERSECRRVHHERQHGRQRDGSAEWHGKQFDVGQYERQRQAQRAVYQRPRRVDLVRAVFQFLTVSHRNEQNHHEQRRGDDQHDEIQSLQGSQFFKQLEFHFFSPYKKTVPCSTVK